MPSQEKPKRRIRSYVRREGRITKAQLHALEELWPKYGLKLEEGLLDFEKIFGRSAPHILEIGIGKGEVLLELACRFPEQDYIGIDVYRPGIGSSLIQIDKSSVKNIRLFCADVIDVLYRCIPDESLDAVHLFFPDPWPKKPHHKRRLVQANFIELIRYKLKFAGYIHMTTDWEDYASHMLKVLTSSYGFINAAGEGQFSPRPSSRPLTKFEKRGQKLGHNIWDLIFIRET